MPNKTYNGFISNNIFELSQNLKRHFLRGYLDGDGYIAKKRYRIVYTVNLLNVAIALQTLLKETCDIDFKIGRDRNNYKVYIEDKKSFFKTLTTLYNDATVFLNRKYIIYKNRIMPSQDENLKMISAELSGELLDNIYEPNDSILC